MAYSFFMRIIRIFNSIQYSWNLVIIIIIQKKKEDKIMIRFKILKQGKYERKYIVLKTVYKNETRDNVIKFEARAS